MPYNSFKMTSYKIGYGSLDYLRELSEGRIAIVLDSVIVEKLNLNEFLFNDILKNRDYKILCDVKEEPSQKILKEAIKEIQEYQPKHIIAIGGGSVIDAAKALWLFYELPEYTWEKAYIYFTVPRFPGKADLIAVPTTSGTGSDTSTCSVIKDDSNHKEMILSEEIMPTIAIHDYNLLRSIPKGNVMYSGMDALAHALEAATAKQSNNFVGIVCTEACVTIIKNIAASVAGDMEAREKIHIAASLAGAGMSGACTGLAHGFDFPGADFNLPHGLVVGLLLPYTMQFLIPNSFYTVIADRLNITGTDFEKQEKLVDRLLEIYKEIKFPRTFKELGVDEKRYFELVPSYIEKATNKFSVLSSARVPDEKEMESLFRQFYYGNAS